MTNFGTYNNNNSTQNANGWDSYEPQAQNNHSTLR